MIMSLSTLFLPYPISSLYTTSYAGEYMALPQTSAIKVREKEYVGVTIVNEYVQSLVEQGYINVTKELNKKRLEQDFALIGVQTSIKPADTIIRAFDYYADFVQISNDNDIYYFKTIEESQSFIDDINQYIKTDYEIQEKVKMEIGSETKDDVLASKIAEAKQKAEEIERRKRVAAASIYVVDTSNISNAPIVQYAIQFVGNPYVYGGTSLTNGTDCSGFTQSVYSYFGKSIPRTASAQAGVGTAVSFDNLQPGDLIFYGNGGYDIAHVAMYIGGSKIVHAGTLATGINICSINIMTKVCARRLL